MAFGEVFRGKKVLVTGHTGFKGAWLAEWLLALGADVTGFSRAPEDAALFTKLELASRLRNLLGDVTQPAEVDHAIAAANPDFVFHLAAQALVRSSYREPVETFATNVMGTAHVLDALRRAASPCVAVMITTDKCYENREWVHAYREGDAMGGRDPYSASKAAAELAIAAYRQSFFSAPDCRIKVASARAGNVIGGGDWALDRIVPDCVRSLQRGAPIVVRNKTATRPWQHVLEPLSGYLWLAACLAEPGLRRTPMGGLASAFNFGPALSSNRTVAALVQEILKHWPGSWNDESDPNAVHEAKLLNLATDKAYHLLGWEPVWDFSESIRNTVAWYRAATDAAAARTLTRKQIDAYRDAARARGLAWAG